MTGFSLGLPFVHFVGEPSEHKEMLIFQDAGGNSSILDKLPQKSAKWLRPPQRHGCKNWKGFHFWLFQGLQKEIFASVRSLKTVAWHINTKQSILGTPYVELFSLSPISNDMSQMFLVALLKSYICFFNTHLYRPNCTWDNKSESSSICVNYK